MTILKRKDDVVVPAKNTQSDKSKLGDIQLLSIRAICILSSLYKIYISLFPISELQHLRCYHNWQLHSWISLFYVLIQAKYFIRFLLFHHITFLCYSLPVSFFTRMLVTGMEFKVSHTPRRHIRHVTWTWGGGIVLNRF